jgi:hypothetical protein
MGNDPFARGASGNGKVSVSWRLPDGGIARWPAAEARPADELVFKWNVSARKPKKSGERVAFLRPFQF